MVGWPKTDVIALATSVKALEHDESTITEAHQASGNRGAPSCFAPKVSPPPFLHYCQHYQSLQGDGFGKRAVKHDILECSSAPLATKNTAKPHQNSRLGIDATTGAKHTSATQSWNALAYCAVVRGIDHAREQHCLFSGAADQKGDGVVLAPSLRAEMRYKGDESGSGGGSPRALPV